MDLTAAAPSEKNGCGPANSKKANFKRPPFQPSGDGHPIVVRASSEKDNTLILSLSDIKTILIQSF